MYTSHAAAQAFLEENKRLGSNDKHLSFFRFTNRKLESSNGFVRMSNCDERAIYYEVGKGFMGSKHIINVKTNQKTRNVSVVNLKCV